MSALRLPFCATLFLALVGSQALASSIAEVSSGTIVKWKKSSVPYWLNPAGSDDISNGSDIAAVHEGFTDWTGLSCSTVSAYEAGTADAGSTVLTNSPPNGKNELTWVETAAWQYGKNVLGITGPMYTNGGSITEADIALNGYLNTWSTVNPYMKVDVKAIVLHEVGHWFGIQHNLDDYPLSNPPTMAPGWDGTLKGQTLEQDDKNAFCFLYGSSYSCSSDDDCPKVVDSNGSSEYYAAAYQCTGGTCSVGGNPGSGGEGGGSGPNSCQGNCGSDAASGCWCDAQCEEYDDCCGDACAECGFDCASGGSGGGTTEGGAGGESGEEGGTSTGTQSCAFYFECIQTCTTQQCLNGCASQTASAELDNANDVTFCLQSSGCFSQTSQADFDACAVEKCTPEYVACFGEAPVSNPEGGESSEEGGGVTEGGGSTTEGGGSTTEGGGSTTEGGGSTTEGGGRISEGGGEVGGSTRGTTDPSAITPSGGGFAGPGMGATSTSNPVETPVWEPSLSSGDSGGGGCQSSSGGRTGLALLCALLLGLGAIIIRSP